MAATDSRWFEYLRDFGQAGRLDEVNFWRPLAQNEFKALSVGEPFFFRLKHPVNAISGYGYFVHATRVSIQLAWEAFGPRNGDPTFERFVSRIADYRRETPAETALGQRELTCIVLRQASFWTDERFVAWGAEQDWARNVVAYKRYDLNVQPGATLAELLRNSGPPELGDSFQPVTNDKRVWAESLAVAREGQGAFRVRLLDAYQRRCAVTGERSLPVLDAAHIQPYRGPVSNHLQNGLVLRADIHRLFDAGYVTVTPELRFEVSRRLKDDFENGRDYYALGGRPLVVLPHQATTRPSREALEWHASNVFR
ncbi:MAG: HNH endonuclease [Dehalococcoidia bacterium]